MPTQETLVLERFFDESGGMQLVLHAPFGSRINKAWGLALRKRFCRQFNFELQAAATEDALMLSLGPQHSFPLADVFRYLHPETTRDVLVQAFLDAPVFKTRWRWNTTISLAVPRAAAAGKRAAAAPADAGRRSDGGGLSRTPRPASRTSPAIGRSPTIRSSTRRCATACRRRWTSTACAPCWSGSIAASSGWSRATRRSRRVFAHEILNARPYAFLDDAPLEERRGMRCRRAAAPRVRRRARRGALDAAAIARVRDEARPDPRDADELHDALMTAGFLDETELAAYNPAWLADLIGGARATRLRLPAEVAGAPLLVAAERLPEWLALHPQGVLDPPIQIPASRSARTWTSASALVEIVRGRLTIEGPTTTTALAAHLGLSDRDVEDSSAGARIGRRRAARPFHALRDRGWFRASGESPLETRLRRGLQPILPRVRWNGATARCSRAFTATR